MLLKIVLQKILSLTQKVDIKPEIQRGICKLISITIIINFLYKYVYYILLSFI
jgi:hypothetical protein